MVDVGVDVDTCSTYVLLLLLCCVLVWCVHLSEGVSELRVVTFLHAELMGHKKRESRGKKKEYL